MKKRGFLLAAAIAAGIALFLCGCAERNPYEVARRETGEETIVLADKDTKSHERILYEEALSDGYGGSYLDFLKELGVSADDSLAVNSALLSSVEVYALFERAGGGLSQSALYYSIGSGVILSLDKAKGDAYIVTNYHVVYAPDSTGRETIPYISDNISLYLYGGKTDSMAIEAEFVGGSFEYDIALLKAEGSEVLKKSAAVAATVGDSDEAVVGERVYAVGDPAAKGISAVSGILSVDAEYINLTLESHKGSVRVSMLEMRTDAPVNHGNSGGGLFDAYGRLIGIVNARSEESGVVGVGYAIPANFACAIAQNILENSAVNDSHALLCADLGVAWTVAGRQTTLTETGTARISETLVVGGVTRGVAFGKLLRGDILLSVRIGGGEKKEITRRHMIDCEMFKVRKGDTVEFELLRGGKTVAVSLTFGDNDDFTVSA